MPVCEWFALCENDAVGTVGHPVLGDVPTCRRCADKLELSFNRRLVRCPTEDREGREVEGCGYLFFAAEIDDEGFADCPRCGLWFDPDHDNSEPQPKGYR